TCVHWFPGKDFGWINRAGRSRRERRRSATEHEIQPGLQSYAPDFGFRSRRRRTVAVVGVEKIGAKHPPCDMPRQVQVEAAASHDPQCLDVVKGIRHEPVIAHQHFEKRRKIAMTKSELWTYREV